jgi:A118 family predicted phage portal protein
MVNKSIKDKLRSIAEFRDITYYYRELGKYIYRGYLPFDIVNSFQASELKKYAYFSEFMHKNKLVPRKTMNIPQAVSGYIVKQMYAEYPQISVPDERQNDVLQQILSENDFNLHEKESFEAQLHIGDRIIKPYIEQGKIRFDYITGDNFFVTRTENYKITSGIFMSTKKVKEKGKTIYYTRVEWHYDLNELLSQEEMLEGKRVVGRGIKVELYKSDDPNERFKTTAFSDLQKIFGELRDEKDEIIPGMPIPTFVYIKNPQGNNKDLNDPRGLGILMNTLDAIISADEAFHAKSTDNVYGSMQKLVPEIATESIYDTRTEAYVRHHNPTDPSIMVYRTNDLSESMPTAYAPGLRTGFHTQSINTDLDIICTNVGISPGALRYDGKSMVTATQVLTEKSETARTIKFFEAVNEEAFKQLLVLIQFYYNTYIKANFFTFEKPDITVQFFDNIISDDDSKLQRMKMDSDDGTIPKWRYISSAYGLNEDEARQWLLEAMQEQALVMAGAEQFFDDSPDGEVQDEEVEEEPVEEEEQQEE